MMNNLDFALLLTDELKQMVERAGSQTLDQISSRQDLSIETKLVMQVGCNTLLDALREAMKDLHEQAGVNVYNHRFQRKENET